MNLELAPYKFICNFCSRHLCIPKYEGGEYYWCTQYQRRFILADDIEQAKQFFTAHFQDQKYWPKGFHKVESFTVSACAMISDYSYDIRTEAGKQKMIAQVDLIQNKLKEYMAKFA